MDFNLTKDLCNRDFDHFMDRVPLGMQSTDILTDLMLLSPGPIWKPVIKNKYIYTCHSDIPKTY